MSYHITAFYTFIATPESDVQKRRDMLHTFGQEHAMRGLVILGTEGINGTVSGSKNVIAEWKKLIQKHFGEVSFKDSYSEDQPFKRWFVKIREEIVTLGNPDICPQGKHHHISPEEWDRMLEEEDVVVIDTRNVYETEIGKFKGAIDPHIRTFQEFPEFVQKSGIPKDKKVMMYCTGGIRCEKALLEMERQGYQQVYQLDGGILRYIQERPQKNFEGECFVFDHRVAVNQDLQPSTRYDTCPHCGDPGDREITCKRCNTQQKICFRCAKHPHKQSCSKDCAYKLQQERKNSSIKR